MRCFAAAGLETSRLSFRFDGTPPHCIDSSPIDLVFAFFDEPANTLESSPHSVRFEVTGTRPDGCRTYDVWMGAGERRWMQTGEQELREPPRRLVTRGWSWTDDRSKRILIISTDRRFSVDGDATRVDVEVDGRLEQPLRHPLQAVTNWLTGGYAARVRAPILVVAKRIEALHGLAADVTSSG